MSDDDESHPSDQSEKLEQVLADYVHSVERGQPLDRIALIAAHPDLAADLQLFFQNRDVMQKLVEPIQAMSDASTILALTGSVLPDAGTRVRYFGNYELLEEIARGGMGIVYKARQVNLNRIVAVKMILAGQLANDEQVKRFHAEATTAAKLDHPGIVPIFEIGEHDGQHYFSMGYVEGQSLASRVADGPIPIRDAAVLVKTVADAVEYAHQQGVVHRDLKPANVLLDPAGQPRVTDFGLAKVLQGDSELTSTGQVLGTPSYMPPEQAAARINQIGPASDTYSLGAILYFLLTGRPPFQGTTPIDTLRQVIEFEPVPVRQLNAQVPIDLETICTKCLQKEPRQRYATAASLADELNRWLEGRPILARPIGPLEQLVRWRRRNPVIAGMAALTIASLCMIAVVSFVGFITTSRALNAADAQAYANQITLAVRDLETSRRNQAVWALQKTPDRRRGWEWRYLMQKCYQKVRQLSHEQQLELSFASTPARAVRHDGAIVDLDGATIAQLPEFELIGLSSDRQLCLGRDPRDPLLIRIGKMSDGLLIGKVELPERNYKALAVTEDHARLVAVFQNGAELSWHVWIVSTGERVATFTHEWAIFERLDNNGRRVVFREPDGLIELLIVCDTSSGERLLRTPGADLGKTIFAGIDPLIRRGNEYLLWNATSETPLIAGQGMELTHAAVSQDEELLVTATSEKHRVAFERTLVDVWRRSSLKRAMQIPIPLSVTQLAVSPNNRWLAIAVQDMVMSGAMSVVLWDLNDGRIEAVLKPEYENENPSSRSGRLGQLVFSPDSTTLAAHDNTRFYDDRESWYVWSVPDDGPHSLQPLSAVAARVAFSDNSKLVAVADASGKVSKAFAVQDAALVACEPVAAELARLSRRMDKIPQVKIDYVSSGKPMRFPAPKGNIQLVYVSPTVVPMLGFTDKGHLEIRSSQDWCLHQLKGHAGIVTAVAFSRDGQVLATASTDESITSGRASLFGARAIDWDSDHFQQSAEIKIWNVGSGTAIQTVRGHSGTINALAFSPDGKRLASAGSPRPGAGIDQSLGGQLIVWDVESGQQLLLFPGNESGFSCVEFSPDGNFLAAAGDCIYLWNGTAIQRPATSKPDERRLFSPGQQPEYPLDSVSVQISSNELTEERCKRLREMPNLERIEIFQPSLEAIPEPGGPVPLILPAFLAPVRQLVIRPEIDARTIEIVADWEGLESLHLTSHPRQMIPDLFRPLLKCKNFKTIELSNVSDYQLGVLGSLSSLKSATVKGYTIGPFLEAWKNLRLIHLDLDSSKLGSDDLQSIGALTSLKTLKINASGLHTPDLSFLKDLSELESLDLNLGAVDQAAIASAVSLKNLKTLMITTFASRLSYDDFFELSFPPQLEELVLRIVITGQNGQALGKTVVLKMLSEKCPRATVNFDGTTWERK